MRLPARKLVAIESATAAGRAWGCETNGTTDGPGRAGPCVGKCDGLVPPTLQVGAAGVVVGAERHGRWQPQLAEPLIVATQFFVARPKAHYKKDGSQFRNYLYVGDLCDAHLRALAPVAGKFELFQRTPQWIMPLANPDWELAEYACTDFNEYANGGWLKKNPIPPDQAWWK